MYVITYIYNIYFFLNFDKSCNKYNKCMTIKVKTCNVSLKKPICTFK